MRVDEISGIKIIIEKILRVIEITELGVNAPKRVECSGSWRFRRFPPFMRGGKQFRHPHQTAPPDAESLFGSPLCRQMAVANTFAPSVKVQPLELPIDGNPVRSLVWRGGEMFSRLFFKYYALGLAPLRFFDRKSFYYILRSRDLPGVNI